MAFLRYIFAMFVLVGMVACGGGGGSPGKPVTGSSDGGTTESTAPTIALELRNAANAPISTVTALDIFSLRATVKDSAGLALAGQVVKFSGDSTLFRFSSISGTGLTDANGVASIQLSPASASVSGAATIGADVTVAGKAATQATLGVQVLALASGGASSAALEMRSPANIPTTTISALDTNTLRATVRDGAGNLLPAQAVSFSSASSLVKFSPAASALTDLLGVATVNVLRSMSTSVGADTISAAATVAGVVVTPVTLNVYVSPLVNGGVPTIALGLRDQVNASINTLSRGLSAFAQVQLLDATGLAPTPTVVTFSGDAALIDFPSGVTGLSDSNGVARIPVAAVSASAGGAGTLRANATVSGLTVASSFVYQVPAGASSGLPTISLGLVGGGNSITASGLTGARATVKDASGAPVAGKIVTFSGNATLIKFSPTSGQVLTDISGVASVQVSPTSLSSAGASTLVAQTTVGSTAISTSFDFQLADANLGLQSLNLGSGSLAAYGNRPISVLATINGLAATSTPVQVTFNASCGQVLPATVTTDATGSANGTYTANLATCAGANATITASAVGATSLSGTISVAESIATNVQFISTTPQLIYLQDSVGTTQAQVVFKVVDSTGTALQNKKLSLSLSNTATGVSLNTVGNTAPVELSTDSLGLVSAAVFSGTVPTSLNVKATLLDANSLATGVFSNSNLLTVASGRPTQSSLSLSLEKFSIEAMNVDGQTSNLTLSMADRQGNPVPPGTQVNFVTESGVMLPAVCFVPPVIPATASSPAIPVSSCSVTLKASGTRTANGLVSILAYVAGEEDFVDLNGNNVYNSGEAFTDLGRAFLDRRGSGTLGAYDSGEFQVPRTGAAVCAGAVGCVGDGVWGAADVRSGTTIVFASGTANITGTFQAPIVTTPAAVGPPAVAAVTAIVGLDVTTGDANGNSVPTGSTVTAAAVDRTTGLTVCTLTSASSITVANTLSPSSASFGFKDCATGDLINITVKTPLGTTTSKDFSIP